jgi:uncharacterized protein (DUF1499 family)
MAAHSKQNPLPPCPFTPNCVRTSKKFNTGIEKLLDLTIQILEERAHSFEVRDPKRIHIHAVYKISVFGFKDDVDIILKESEGSTTVFIRSASRLGAFDFWVNQWRVKQTFRLLESNISP